MSLSREQIDQLLSLVANVVPDGLDCDGCLRHVAEFAEQELRHREIPAALAAVEMHLAACPCCAYEYQALLDGLHALEEGADPPSTDTTGGSVA